MNAPRRDLERRLAVVTGGSAGIGAATVLALAARGATVAFSHRNAARGEDVARRARALGGDALPMPLDLCVPDSIRAFADEVKGLGRPIDLLVQNAGAVFRREQRTADGLDAQAAVIHYGPLLLTHLLVDRLARPARVVDIVSDLHRRVRAEDIDRPAPYRFIDSYARAELRKVLVSRELSRRLAPRGADVHSVHPGGVRTRLFRDIRGPLGVLFALTQPLKMSPESGARGILYAACDIPAGTTGAYVINGRFGARLGRPSRAACDDRLARRVYEEDCRRVGAAPLPALLP